jgi:hypothetical protein
MCDVFQWTDCRGKRAQQAAQSLAEKPPAIDWAIFIHNIHAAA